MNPTRYAAVRGRTRSYAVIEVTSHSRSLALSQSSHVAHGDPHGRDGVVLPMRYGERASESFSPTHLIPLNSVYFITTHRR
eukprot:6185810-Pleurochrysis_carterae.AAC.5